jgi:hypothetical protein
MHVVVLAFGVGGIEHDRPYMHYIKNVILLNSFRRILYPVLNSLCF